MREALPPGRGAAGGSGGQRGQGRQRTRGSPGQGGPLVARARFHSRPAAGPSEAPRRAAPVGASLPAAWRAARPGSAVPDTASPAPAPRASGDRRHRRRLLLLLRARASAAPARGEGSERAGHARPLPARGGMSGGRGRGRASGVGAGGVRLAFRWYPIHMFLFVFLGVLAFGRGGRGERKGRTRVMMHAWIRSQFSSALWVSGIKPRSSGT